jgi:hypothetical protein
MMTLSVQPSVMRPSSSASCSAPRVGDGRGIRGRLNGVFIAALGDGYADVRSADELVTGS